MLVKTNEIIPVKIVSDRDNFVCLHRGHVLGYAFECDTVLQDKRVQ